MLKINSIVIMQAHQAHTNNHDIYSKCLYYADDLISFLIVTKYRSDSPLSFPSHKNPL